LFAAPPAKKPVASKPTVSKPVAKQVDSSDESSDDESKKQLLDNYYFVFAAPPAKKPEALKPTPTVSKPTPSISSGSSKRRISKRTYTVDVEVMDQGTQTGDFDEPMEVGGDENGCKFFPMIFNMIYCLDEPPTKIHKPNGHLPNGDAKHERRASSPFRRVKTTKEELPVHLRDNSYKV
jgi:hypothetical protein